MEQTTALRSRADGVPVFAFTPSPGAPPVGMLQFRGDEIPPPRSTPGLPHSHDFVALSYFERPGGSLRLTTTGGPSTPATSS